MSSYMPFQNTTINERRSVSDIEELLDSAGFDQVASVSNKQSGRRAVIAEFSGAQFVFEVDTLKMEEVAIKHLSERGRQTIRRAENDNYYKEDADKILDKLRSQVVRIGWRLMHEQIKHICDAIKWGVVTPAEAFSGYLKLPNGQNLASQVTSAIESGQIESQGFQFLQLEQKS